MTGPETDGPTWDAFGAGHALDREELRFAWRAYVPDEALRAHPDVSPDRAESLAGLPPALVVTAEYDQRASKDLVAINGHGLPVARRARGTRPSARPGTAMAGAD